MKKILAIFALVLYSVIEINARTCSNRLPPYHGYKFCSNRNNGRSVCYFRCKPGYILRGYTTARCQTNGYWTRLFPNCVKIDRCSFPLKAPENGQAYCSLRNYGSHVCGFRCNKDYIMRGFRYSFCSHNRWSNYPPVCEPVQNIAQCEGVLAAPENGSVSCEGCQAGDTCFFECDQGFVLQGSSSSLCVRTRFGYFWSRSPPVCKKQIKCSPLENVENAEIVCLKSRRDSGICRVKCEEGFQLKPSNNGQLQCLENGQWNVTTPCCAASPTCREFQRADVVIAIDSSSSFGLENIKTSLQFTRDFIDSFSISEQDTTRFGIFRYNDEVDTTSQIFLDDFGDRQSLLNSLQKFPSLPEGETNTGVALRHIKDVMLTDEKGKREDVQSIAILLTGSKSNDNATIPALELRGQIEGLKLYVIGFNPESGEIDVLELQSLVAIIQDFIFAEPGTDVSILDQVLSERIGNSLCRVQC